MQSASSLTPRVGWIPASPAAGIHTRTARSNSDTTSPRSPRSVAVASACSSKDQRSAPPFTLSPGAPKDAACTCTLFGASLSLVLPRSWSLHPSGSGGGGGSSYLPLASSPAARPRKCSAPCVLLCVTLLLVASLQLFLSHRTSAAFDLAPTSSSLALSTVVVDVPRLESQLRYQQSIVLHLRDLIAKDCERQLRMYGWGDEQIHAEKALYATWGDQLASPRSPYPPLSWSAEQQEHFHIHGCINAIMYPRALGELKRNYAQLVARYEASMEQRARDRNGTILHAASGKLVNRHGWRMERGLYSAKHRREGTCGVELRCVIALSLYGSSPRYTTAIQSSVLRLPRVFPGWELRVYFDHTVPAEILGKLLAHERAAAAPGADHAVLAKLELVNVTSVWPVGSAELSRISGAFYRFLVADDPSVDRWISRDCDALLLERDAAAVHEWLESGWTFHTMADFPQHGSMLAGMWGAVNYARHNGTITRADGTTSIQSASMITDAFGGRSMQRLIEDFTLRLTLPNNGYDASNPPNPKTYGCDQWFQMAVILPVLEIDYIGHDSYHCHEARNSFSFPLQRPEPYVFIGQTQAMRDDGSSEMDGLERTEPAWELPMKRPAPVECRRKPEWIYG